MMAGQDRYSWQKAICNRSGLPATARLVALAISLQTDPTGGQGVWLSSSDIARMTGLKSLNTVNVYSRKVEAAGWISRSGGARFLAWPGELEPARCTDPDCDGEAGHTGPHHQWIPE